MKKTSILLLVFYFTILTQTGWTGTDNHSLIVHENNEAANIGFAARFFDSFHSQLVREFTTMGMMLSSGSVTSQVNTSSDDAEERLSDGLMDLASTDLELINDPGDGDQIVGMRFNNINIPQGATITSASIDFVVDELDSGATNLIFSGQAIDNAPTFTSTAGNISSRTPTANNVTWTNVGAWSTANQIQPTPDLLLIIQEIVNREGWVAGNSLVILVEGSGERTAHSYNGSNANAPTLQIDYSTATFSCASGVISNPDFESGFTNWGLTGSTTVLTNDAYDGTQAALTTGSDGGVQQALAGTPGNAYGLSVYARKTGTAVPVAGIEFYDSGWGYISGKHLTVNSTDWEEYSRTIVAPANTAYVMFSGRNNSGTGNAYFDGFCTEELVLTAPSCSGSSCNLVPHSNENIMVIDASGNGSGTMDYDNADLMICDNGDGTLSIKGNIISGRDASWDPGTGTPCGLDDAWYVDLTLSDMKTYAEFTSPIVADASCDNRTDWDYWNISGTFTGIGCNTGRTLNMVQHQNGYRIQIGWGATTTNCNFGLSTWFEGDEGGTFIQGDIYANLDEACYTAIRPETNLEICNNGIDDDGDGLTDCNDPDCNTGAANAVLPETIGVDNAAAALGLPDGNFAEAYDGTDTLLLDLGQLVPAGSTYTLTWKRKDYGSAGTAVVFVAESGDDYDYFTRASSISTTNNTSFVTLNLTAEIHTRYLKLYQEDGLGDDFEVDAVTYSIECPTEICDNGIDDDGDGLIDCDDPDCGFDLNIVATDAVVCNTATILTASPCTEFVQTVAETTGNVTNGSASVGMPDGQGAYFDEISDGTYTRMIWDMGEIKAIGSDICFLVKSNSEVNPSKVTFWLLDNEGTYPAGPYLDIASNTFVGTDWQTICFEIPLARRYIKITDEALEPFYIDAIGQTCDGAAEFSYAWSTGATTADITVSPTNATTYTVTVTNENNCSVIEDFTINTCEVCDNGVDDDGDGLIDCADGDCNTPTISSVDATNPTCPDVNDGSISITASGSNLQYSIDGGSTFQAGHIFTNLTAATYSIVVQNSVSGCQDTDSATLTSPSCGGEICDNGIDDDNDGYIDELDSDCFNCPTAPTSGLLFSADFENTSGDNNWTFGNGATDGNFEIGVPSPYITSGTDMEIAAHGGLQDLLTGDVNGQDLDGGPTSAQSPDICLPTGATCINLNFFYYFSDASNGDASDYLNIEIRDAISNSVLTTVVSETGSTADNDAAWTEINASLAAYAGSSVYIYLEAADLGGGSKTEVAIDDITVQVCAEICGNGQDDDGDTLVDCDDDDCSNCGEICGNGIDDDGDMLVDCNDPDCYALSVNNPTVSTCIDHPLRDVATVSVDVSWSNAPSNDTIEVTLGDKIEYIDVAGGVTSPYTVEFMTIADGSSNNMISASWRNNPTNCTTPTTFDAPTACSNDTIACNILYLCGSEKPYDGDAWDHGWIEYLDEMNGASTVTPILTKADGSGMGTYNPNSPTTFVNVTLTDYDLIVISATTENYLATDLVNDLKNASASILNSNYQIINDLGMSAVEGGYTWGSAAYTDDATQVEIYNYDNINADYSYVFTRGDYRSNADAYLWAYAGDETAEQNGYMFANTAADYFPGVSPHGFRVYLGYHMNGLYANPVNGGVIPAPASAWFSPEKHLTLTGKEIFDQAIVLASPCEPEICDDQTDNNGDGFIDCQDAYCSTFIDLGNDTTICLGDVIILNAQPTSTTAGTNYSYNWNIPNGYSSHTVNPVDLDTFFVRVGISGGCTWRDTIIVNVQGLLIGGVTVSDCYDSNGSTVGGNSVVDVQVMVDWVNAPSGDQIQVAVDGAATQAFDPSVENMPHILTFTVPADGSTGNVIANFVTNTSICPDNAIFTAPNGNCVETPCTATGGTVWNDNNNDGVKDTEEIYGFSGVTVTADWDDCAGNTGTVNTITDAYGQYDLSGIPSGAMLSVTFSNLPADYTCMEGSVSQVTTAPDCNIDLGLTDCTGAAAPAWLQKGYSVVTCLPGSDEAVLATKDIRQMGTLWDTPSNRGNDQGNAVPTTHMWTIDQFDNHKVLAVAVDKRDGTIYVGTSGMVGDLQHSGGTVFDTIVYPIIYKITPDEVTPRPFAMMPGRLGVGSMDIDYQHNQIFATEIDGGKIYRFDMQSGKQQGTAFDPLLPDDGVLFEVPPLGDFINGIGYNEVENKIYYAVYYNQYKHNDWVKVNDDFNTIRSVQLDANGNILTGTDTEEITLPKIADPASLGMSHGVADIEFNEAGDKVLFAEMGVNKYEYYNSFPPYELYDVSYKASTHIHRVLEYYDNGGTWTMSPIYSGNYNSKFDIGDQTQNEGLNSRGGVDWAYKSIENGEVVGFEDFILATGDRLSRYATIYGYQLTPATGGDQALSVLANLGDAGGAKYTFGDVEVYKGTSCEKRIAIGDLVWLDENQDGVQNICEAGLENVNVQLYDAACQLIGTTVSSPTGYYLFDNNNVDTTGLNGVNGFTGLSPNTNYYIVVGEGQYNGGFLNLNGSSYSLTTTDAGGSDNLDNDASEGVACGNINSLPFIAVHTADAGCLDTSNDFGFGIFCDNVTDAGSVTGDEEDCGSFNPSEITELTAPSGGVGNIQYQWQSSIDNITFTEISGATVANYNPTAITQTTYYQRKARREGCDDNEWLISNTIVKEIIGSITDPGSIAGNEGNCGSFDPTEITETASPTGGQGGSIKFQWQSSPDGSTWSDISGATAATYNPPTINQTMHYRRGTRRASCNAYLHTNVIVKTVETVLANGGTISGDESNCIEYTSSLISNVTNASGGLGSIEYTWQSSTDNVNWTTIPGANEISYQPGQITQTTYFQRLAQTNLCGNPVASNVVTKEKTNPLFCLQSGEWSYDCLDGVCSEIIGVGNQGQTSAALGTGDSSTVQFIVVEATFSGGSGSPDQVTFSSSNGESIMVDKQYFEGESGSSGDRYFQAELTTADSIFVDYPANATNRAESFVAYLFRDCEDSGSYGKFVHTKLSGGESDTTHFVIPQGNETRDILIEVPLSELTNDGRIVNVHASAGGVSKTLVVSNYNQGNSLNLTPFTLENVPSSADTVTIVVESPSGGQSVYLSGAVSARLECAARLTVNPSASVDCAAEGTSITYSYNIINYGTNEINNITASDDLTGNIGLGTTTLQSGQSMGTTSSYTVQASDFPGPLFNIVIVSGTDAVTSEVITDTFQVEIPLVAASLTITVDTTSAIVGDTITYTYQMQNLGSTALNLGLTDDLIGNVLEARVNDGLQVLYTFDEGSGSIIRDVSGVGDALDLTIETPANTTWGNSFLTVHTETRATNVTIDNKVHQSCTASNEVSLEVWIKPLNNTQGGPARMLGYSIDSGDRNVQLSQDGNDYNGRLRTTDNDRNELDGTGNHVDSSPTWQHIVYTYDGLEAKIYVNGVHISDSGMDNPTGDFSTWNPSYALVLFNEYLDSRSWLGDMGLAAIYSKALDQAEVTQNYNEGYENITGNLAVGDSLTWTSQYVVQSSDFPSPLNNQATLTATALEGCAVTVQDDVAVILCTNADCIEYCNDGIDNDGDGLTDCEDDDCVSISDGGMIDGTEKDCGAYDPAAITNMDLPSNHNGNTIQYEWEQSTDFGFSWTIISGAVAESFDPATITITTRYRRKARLFDCDPWEISNEIIKKVVGQPTANDDSFDSCPGVTFTDNVSVNDSQIDAPTFSIIESTTNGTVSIDSLGEFTYTPTGVNCNTDQFSYQVCNDETSCCSIAIVTINLADSAAPNLVNVPADLTLECEETIPELPLVLAIDNCPAISITVDEVSTQTETGCGRFSYTITRTWLAADFCGNDVSDSQIITVQDTTPPTFTVPSAAFLPCSENKDDLTITGDATDELDNCSTNLQAVYTDNESNLNLAECRGFITRTWTLTDLCGNTATEDQLIYIFDDTDRDKDGTPDILDLDDDNDGIPDVDETYNDTDGDGVTNNLDLDSDNDGIPDIIEAGFIDSNGDGIVDNLGLPGWDDDGDGFADGFDANDMDTSLVASDNFEPLSPIRDRDGDNVTNFWDLDSDNDGVGDLIETGGVDTNGDGIIDYPTISDPTSMIDADGDGFADVYDPDNDGNPGSESPNQPLITYNGVEYIDGTSSKNWDEDGDDIPNLYDLDGDNDGIADLIEAQAIDTDGDGKIDLIGEFEDVNGDGFHDNYSVLSLVTTDTDGATIDGRPEDDDGDGTPYNGCDLDKDGIMNQLDLESDGDGILDIIEIGNAAADADGDGRLDNTTDSNKDGFDDNLAAIGFITTDGDGATDDGRPEDDGDSDISPFSTSSADGWMGEANGEADIDDDGDAQLNFLDTDSDGDLIPDNVEDANQNGIQDAGETGAYDSDSDDDLIRDGTEDTNINGIFEVGETDPLNPNTDGDPLDDGVEDANQNGVVDFSESDPRDPCDPFLNESCIGVALDIKIRLQGALMGTNDTLMRDDLRRRNLLPLDEPYYELDGFLHEGTGGGEIVDTSVFMVEGPNAIVDWVLVELRDATEPSIVIATRSALLQRDGDVVDTSGLAPLRFPEVSSGSYYVAVRHRNHLGVMTYGTYILSPQVKTIDFRTPSTLTYGGEEAQYKENGRMHLWAGDINSDHKVIYQGPENDILNMFLRVLTDEGNINYYANYVRTGYDSSDLDMNGTTIYQGPGNDRGKVLIDVILKHGGNVGHFANYVVWEKMP